MKVDPVSERRQAFPDPAGGSYDLVVVGSGIAGLYAAILAASRGKVLLVTKSRLEESNTRYAQGGIAAALDDGDSPELHLRDTAAAGDGLCDLEPLSVLTRDAPSCIEDLIRLGVPFDQDGSQPARTLEAAHSLPRVLHAGGDATGFSIETALSSALRTSGAKMLDNTFCTSLVVEQGRVRGVELLLPNGLRVQVRSSHVLVASGGAGRLFARTTNPAVATGDGIAMAFEAGAELMDLEFVQFHPTALAIDGAPAFLISEAVRGEGGVLRNARGRAFMADYHRDRELAPRDVVARAIHGEMLSAGSSSVWMDLTHLPKETLERRFPTIMGFCRKRGVEPTVQPIPVAPAAHYMMGGIVSDSWGRTSIPGLYACGEVACTGVHGANRLASNSLLEGLVFARRVVRLIANGNDEGALSRPASLEMDIPSLHPVAETTGGSRQAIGQTELAEEMWREAGLVRSRFGLFSLLETIESLCTREAGDRATGPENEAIRRRGDTADDYERSNLLTVSRLVVQTALLREESRGAHYRSDFPERSASWRGHIAVSKSGARFLSKSAVEPFADSSESRGRTSSRVI